MTKGVLVFVPSDRVGGAEQVLKIVATEALQRGYRVEVVCWTAGTSRLLGDMRHENLSVKVLVRSREWRGMFAGLFHFAIRKRRAQYSLAFSSHVHCNAYLAFLRLVGLLRTDRLVCRESTVIPRRFKGLRRLFYRACYLFYRGPVDLVVCQTEDMRQTLLRFAPWISKARVMVVPNPISAHVVNRDPRPAVGTSPFIVSVGRLIPEKGYSTLIAAVPILLKTRPGAIVEIYGEGPLGDQLQALIRSMHLEQHIRLRGFTRDPYPVMRMADVCVVCSNQEGFPNTLLEMMRANLRVVSTLCADGIDAIAGVEKCRPNDPAELADAIERALDGDVSGNAALFDNQLAARKPQRFFDVISRGPLREDSAFAALIHSET